MIRSLRSRVCYVTPEPTPDTAGLARLVREVLRAGVGLVQYRAKGLPARRMVQDVVTLLTFTRPAGVPLIVNDRVDIALAAGADGAHVGQDDLPVALARRLLGPYAILGASAATPELARQAERDGASYIGCGAVFPTATKPEAAALGIAGVAAVRRAVGVPVCAIGGITAENLAEFRELKPELVAVISAINDAPDPGAAARELVAKAKELWG